MINADSEKRRKTLIRVHLSTAPEAKWSLVPWYVHASSHKPDLLVPVPFGAFCLVFGTTVQVPIPATVASTEYVVGVRRVPA